MPAAGGEGVSRVRFLSDEWLAALKSAAKDLPPTPGCSLNLKVDVSDSPDGRRRLGVRVVDGQLAEVSLGFPVDADCTLTCSYTDAAAMWEGRLDPAVAYMQGKLKLEGAYERVLFGLRPMLSGASRDALRELRERLAAL